MYLDYWNLSKHAFKNVPDPSMYFCMHQSVESAVGELLFAIEEGDECLAVITGGVGVGKTTAFRIVLDSIEEDAYKIAFVTNPDLSFSQLLREIIGQLEGAECTERRREKLLERFNRLLFETNDQGKRVLIFIDEGNVIKPANLDSLRLLTNMTDDEQNLFTIVLAGQPELAEKLEEPCRENLFQRIGVYCKLEAMTDRNMVKDYVEHRLERAGCQSPQSVFSPEAHGLLWAASKGVPRLINKYCKLCLKAGETNGITTISGEIAKAVIGRFIKESDCEMPAHKAVPAAPPAPELEPMVDASTDEVVFVAPTKEPHRTPLSEMRDEPPKTVEQRSTNRLMKTLNQLLPGHSKKEKVDLLAIQKVKQNQKKIKDPYQDWLTARQEILADIGRHN